MIIYHERYFGLHKAGFFLDRLKKTQGRENSSFKKITQNSSKKLKVSAKFLKLLEILTQFKCKIHFNVCIIAEIPNFKLKYCKNSPFIRGNWLIFKIIQEKNSTTQGKNSKLKTKTQGFGKVKNAVCRKRVQKKCLA